jgi:hypothetical protein
MESPIDIATLTFETPIWISPPVKVKHLGVITKIITSLYSGSQSDNNFVDGLGQPVTGQEVTATTLLSRDSVTITDYNIQVYNGEAILLGKSESSIPREPTLDIPTRQGTPIEWQQLFDAYPGKFIAGSSTIFLTQPNGTEVIGTVAVSPVDPTILIVAWDADTRPSDTLIDSQGNLDTDPEYGVGVQYRSGSPGTFEAIINPQKVYPGHGMTNVVAGDRFLIVDDIIHNTPAWGNFVASANDIIEYNGTSWNVIFHSAQEATTLLWQTNIYTGVQYTWNGVYWGKSFEGEYKAGEWRLVL